MFDRFVNRYTFTGDIRTKTALHIGANQDVLAPRAVDNGFIKDVNGDPFIPGSSLKGVMRSFLERVLRNDENSNVCSVDNICLKDFSLLSKKVKILKEAFPNAEEVSDEMASKYVYDHICAVCRIFGGANNAAKLMIRDARLKEGSVFAGFEIRNGVTIDRDTNTAARGKLFEVEVVPADTVFSFKAVGENLTDEEYKDVLVMLKSMQEGFIDIGGMTTRGCGSIELENVQIEKIEGKEIFEAMLKNKKNITSLSDEIKRVGEMYV